MSPPSWSRKTPDRISSSLTKTRRPGPPSEASGSKPKVSTNTTTAPSDPIERDTTTSTCLSLMSPPRPCRRRPAARSSGSRWCGSRGPGSPGAPRTWGCSCVLRQPLVALGLALAALVPEPDLVAVHALARGLLGLREGGEEQQAVERVHAALVVAVVLGGVGLVAVALVLAEQLLADLHHALQGNSHRVATEGGDQGSRHVGRPFVVGGNTLPHDSVGCRVSGPVPRRAGVCVNVSRRQWRNARAGRARRAQVQVRSSSSISSSTRSALADSGRSDSV